MKLTAASYGVSIEHMPVLTEQAAVELAPALDENDFEQPAAQSPFLSIVTPYNFCKEARAVKVHILFRIRFGLCFIVQKQI